MDAVCLIAAPGAGTFEFGRILANCPDVASHDQVFRPQALRGISPEGWVLLSRLTGIRFGRTDDPGLAAFARQQPMAWLDAVEAADAGKRLIAFSIFSDDLSTEAVEQVLTRPGLRVVFVMRKQIEAYIAWQRALIELRSEGPGTPRVKLKVDVDAFTRWLTEQERWYARWQDWLKRRFLPAPMLRYETDIDQPAARVLRRAAAAVAQVGLTLRLPASAASADPERPPRPLLAEVVANWPEVNREIFARGLERRAFGYPLPAG